MNIISVFTPVVLFLGLGVPTAVLAVVEYFLARVESPWPGPVSYTHLVRLFCRS